MASWEFPRTDPIELRIQIASGSVVVNAEPTDVVRVVADSDDLAGDLRVDYADGRLSVTEPRPRGLFRRGSDLDLAVTVPVGSHCEIRTASADVRCYGEPGSLDVRTASGDASIRGAGATVAVYTASGQIHVTKPGADVTATSASGDISIDGPAASVTTRTASGAIDVARAARGHVEANSVSGDIVVTVAPGTDVYLELSSLTGQVTSTLEPLPDAAGQASLSVTCHCVSGDVRVARAVPASITS